MALNARRPADAVGPARQAVALIEDDARGHLLTALAVAEGAPAQGDAEDGVVQSLQRAWALSPDAFVVWVDRVARALVTRGALPFAERVVLRGVQTRPPGPGRGILYMQLANLRMAQGPAHLPSAIEAYGHAAQDGITDSLSLRLAQRRAFDLRGGVGPDPRAASNMPSLPGRPVLESELHRYPLPETEALARRAYWHELRGDRAEAIATWRRITEGPWAPLATAAAQELQASRSSR